MRPGSPARRRAATWPRPRRTHPAPHPRLAGSRPRGGSAWRAPQRVPRGRRARRRRPGRLSPAAARLAWSLLLGLGLRRLGHHLRQVEHGANLGGPVVDVRHLCRPSERRVQIWTVEDVVAAKELLRLGERAVDDLALAITHTYGGRAVHRLERPA